MADIYKELIKLRNKVLKLGSLAETAIQDSVKSLVERKSDLAKKVIKKDKQINALDIEIDEDCIKLLALGKLSARELRLVAATLKITNKRLFFLFGQRCMSL